MKYFSFFVFTESDLFNARLVDVQPPPPPPSLLSDIIERDGISTINQNQWIELPSFIETFIVTSYNSNRKEIMFARSTSYDKRRAINRIYFLEENVCRKNRDEVQNNSPSSIDG